MTILMVTFTGRGITYYLKYKGFSWVANHLLTKIYEKILYKQTSSNLNTNQLPSQEKQKNKEMPLTSTFIQSGPLPVTSIGYVYNIYNIYNSTFWGEFLKKKAVKPHVFSAIYRGPTQLTSTHHHRDWDSPNAAMVAAKVGRRWSAFEALPRRFDEISYSDSKMFEKSLRYLNVMKYICIYYIIYIYIIYIIYIYYILYIYILVSCRDA